MEPHETEASTVEQCQTNDGFVFVDEQFTVSIVPHCISRAHRSRRRVCHDGSVRQRNDANDEDGYEFTLVRER